ncbi:MAG: DNA alkylation repair protein [Candidatus Nanoarchaeia archaeon]
MSIQSDLDNAGSKEQALIQNRFFKTGKGHYGEGDLFIGIRVPEQRLIASTYKDLSLKEIEELLKNPIHEYRLTALLILINQFKKHPKEVYEFYMKNLKYVNNWDLVDASAPKITGAYLFDKDKTILSKLAKSSNLWEKRVAIVSTYYFIQKNHFTATFKIAELLLSDKHDLIHKAIGWMLREVGKKDQHQLEAFLQKNYNKLPRTTLRYAIERFDEKKRKQYLNNTFTSQHVITSS